MTVDELLKDGGASGGPSYNYAFLDEQTKRELRRKALKAVSIPGHQVPFGSREMPLARGWGTGGLQLSLALVGPGDVYKAIDQGADDSVNAVNMRSLVRRMAEVETTEDTREATIIQTRHRIPEEPLRGDQTMVFQVPIPEPLERVEPRISRARKMHAEKDYSKMWLYLYESIALHGEITVGARYPVLVNGTYLMDPSPIPRWDVPKLDGASFLSLFGAGREKRIYAIPPHTNVEPLEFEDHPFRVERFDEPCGRCGSADTFLDEMTDETTGERYFRCSDTSFCDGRLGEK
ncbi:carbon-phosphorus lyase complex subunit PhnJ [Rubrobacter tropicus]|uniref:Carbon-phosphorus lyase complex subunit PhnJ n=1 Tax=Rubrobacter tropicus TaxID=2653851 RepID=A0A6G8Q4H7_9ACTN|nr:alpha-D-ribose 1-methylphosphonate 5-phosphate C-P-lyase PhnJ [Rubrobacter tropicus]QIN81329.1 carbon-phosphorus lyase complex subunit PhnJ [Rubrobacter tropicus]